MLKQGNEDGFVRNAVAAWNARPHRAEPLYDLARFHRDRRDHAAATLFAVQGMRIPWPKDDTLFIEDWIYDWGLKEEYAISGYYVSDHRDQAAVVCNTLALNARIPAATRDQARRNLRFYTRPLQEILPAFETNPISFTAEPSWNAANSSVVRWNDALWMIQRTMDSKLTGTKDSFREDGGPVQTRNFLLRLGPSFVVLHAAELRLPADLPPPAFTHVLGFGDVRPFVWNNGLWATATVRDQNEAGWCEVMLFRIDGAGTDTPRAVDWRVLHPAGPPRHEKNWMAVASGENLRFIYSIAPTRIIDVAARELSHLPAPWAADQMQGGSHAIPFGPGWLAVVHEHVSAGKAHVYLHRFVWFDRSGTLRRISAPFNLMRSGVGLVAGLAWHPDGRRLVISFGTDDAKAWIGHLPAADLPALLTRRAPIRTRQDGHTSRRRQHETRDECGRPVAGRPTLVCIHQCG